MGKTITDITILREEVYAKLSTCQDFNNLSMDRQGELCIEVTNTIINISQSEFQKVDVDFMEEEPCNICIGIPNNF